MNDEQKKLFVNLSKKIPRSLHNDVSNLIETESFNNKPFYVKLWRYRWFVRVPYDTLIIYYTTEYDERSLKRSFEIAMLEANYRMKWHYIFEETVGFLMKRGKK